MYLALTFGHISLMRKGDTKDLNFKLKIIFEISFVRYPYYTSADICFKIQIVSGKNDFTSAVN